MKQPHWIANQARFSDTEFQVRNPADTRMVVGTITLGTADLVDHAVNAALKAPTHLGSHTPRRSNFSAINLCRSFGIGSRFDDLSADE